MQVVTSTDVFSQMYSKQKGMKNVMKEEIAEFQRRKKPVYVLRKITLLTAS